MTRKPAAERKRQIVDATLTLLARVPLEELSTNRIAEEVGVTDAAIFRHYATKQALWVGVLEAIERQAHARWEVARRVSLPPPGRLLAVVRAQLGLISDYPAVPVILFNVGSFATEDALRPIHARLMDALREELRHGLEEMLEEGTIPLRAPAPDIVDLLLGVIQGVVLRWSLSGREFDLVQEGARLIAVQLRLLGAELKGNQI